MAMAVDTVRTRPPTPSSTPATGNALPHVAGLDGLRGAAVLVVLAYHLGWLRGGFLGVSLFFTLSGYLITNLLLQERARSGSIRLGHFWARRARRLLPAALAAVVVAVVVTALAGTPDQLRALPGDVLGALGYVANWRFVLAGQHYNAGFAAPSPLLHFWSLAIEEQLYLVLPLLVVLTRRRSGLALTLVALLVLSGWATARIGPGHADRIYFGTDTRMAELLAGSLLAVATRFPGTDRPGTSRWTSRLAIAASVGFGGLVLVTTQADAWLYRGGFWAVAALSSALILGAGADGPLERALRTPPLVWAGTVSYGLYVYHWPLFVLIDASHTGLTGPALAAARLAATAAVAMASHRFVEMPVRRSRRSLPRLSWAVVPVTAAGIVAAALVVRPLAAPRSVVRASSHHLIAVAAPTVVITSPATVVQPSPAFPEPASSPVPPGRTNPAVDAGATGSPRSTSAPIPPLRRVLFMGDSLVQQAFPTFSDRLRAAGVTAQAVGGNGQSLMTHDAAWLDQLAGAVATFDPDVVVLESCCGQFRFDAPLIGADGTVVAPGTPAFYQAWHRLASRATTLAAARGALVVWVLGPPTRTNGWYGGIDAQVTGINRVYSSLASCQLGLRYIDWGRLGGAGGTYTDTLTDDTGQQVRVRTTDGFHFTPTGIDALADLTLPALQADWSESGRPGVPATTCG